MDLSVAPNPTDFVKNVGLTMMLIFLTEIFLNCQSSNHYLLAIDIGSENRKNISVP